MTSRRMTKSQLILTTAALAFLVIFLLLPLVTVFAEALSKGLGAYAEALSEPDALSAIRLTLLVAALGQINGMAPEARGAGQQFRGGIGNGLIQRLGRGTAMHHPWRPGKRSSAKRAAPKRPAPLPRLAGAITRS